MNVQRVERIADFVRHAGGQQSQRLDALAFNGLKGFLPRLGRIMQNQRHAGTAGGFAIQRRGVEPQKARTRIIHFKFVPRDAPAALRGQSRERSSQSSSGRKRATCWPSTPGCKPSKRVTA